MTTNESVTTAFNDVLGRWAVAFNNRDLDAMAELFTNESLFQGFAPKVVMGVEAVREYFASLPEHRRAVDITPSYTYEIGEQMVGGFADVTFCDPDGWQAPVHLSLVIERGADDWQIRQYHASRVQAEHD
jgi:uncharacterized protein (TIGR02246 family)